MSAERPARPRVVIVGAGFGGLNAARALAREPVDVVMIDRHNYHLFQPLLYQVAVAGLSPGEIAYPVRSILRRQANFEFRVSTVEGFDIARRRLATSDGEVPYDVLILGLGTEANYFGLEGVRRHALGLKDLTDALRIRNHVMSCVERAALDTGVEERQALLTLAVVGGGPTGVEMAGAFAELVRLVLARDFRKPDLDRVRVVLLEAGERILPSFTERLGRKALKSLEAKRVEVRTEALVEDYDGARIRLRGGEIIPARTLVWAAGVKASSLLGKVGVPLHRSGRVPVEPTLQVPGHPELFVIGDAAYLEHEGKPLAQVAQPAIQMGRAAARNAAALLAGRPLRPFHYVDPGNLATIGRNAAVADIGPFEFSGFPAWVVWVFVHLVQLIGFRNRLVVLVDWIWDYFAYTRAAPLILKE